MKIIVLHDPGVDGDPHDEAVDDVRASLAAAGHDARTLALQSDVPALASALLAAAPDLIFNLTESFHGKSALDSSVASLLNLLDMHYTGSSHAGLMLAGDKALAKKVLSFHDVLTPEFATLHRGTLESAGTLNFPLIVKPPQEDASIGITTKSVVHTLNELLERMDDVQRAYRSPVLVEEFIPGREFYVGVLGNERPQALAVCELDMSAYPADVPRVASWEAKWEGDHAEYTGSVTTFPDLDASLLARINDTCLRAYAALRLRDYARIDLRVTDAGEVYVIEVNPNCYLKRGEVFAEAASRSGIDYDALIARIVELAAARYAS